jgi:hypothetical protein
MHGFPARWTKSLAAAALLTLPLAASAQTTAPAQTAPAQTQSSKVDAAASKQHLSAARDTLSQLTSMPEAARLQGDARTQVSQIISSFNELITTQADWRSSYAKVDTALTAVLGPDGPDPAPPTAGVTGAVGTAGAVAAPAALDPAVRAKLVEFRTHIREFERAAGGKGSSPAGAPDATMDPATPTTPPAGTAGTSGVTPSSPAAAAPAVDQAKAAEQAGHSEADKHLDAISAILNQSKTGALTRAQTAALKKHVAELRALLNKS